jgi:cytidine deaminase
MDNWKDEKTIPNNSILIDTRQQIITGLNISQHSLGDVLHAENLAT